MKHFTLLSFFALVGCSTSTPNGNDAGSPATPVIATQTVQQPARPPGEAPPPAIDLRTPDQIAQAACRGRDGAWYCPKIKPLAAVGSLPPVLPASWSVPNWFIDPANSTGCASDANNCTSGCGGAGAGPCRTWGELVVHRWGCLGTATACPRLRQNTQVLFLSSQSGNSDPVYFRPAAENGAVVSIQGAIASNFCTGTLAGVVAKNQATGQLLNATLCPGLQPGLLVHNTTGGKASFAWTYKNVSGNTWSLSQPLVPSTIPQNGGTAEVNTWANLDTFAVVNLVNINLVDAELLQTDYNAGFSNILYLYQMNVLDPVPTAGDNLFLEHAALIESTTKRFVIYRSAEGEQLTNYGSGMYNVANLAGLSGGGWASWYFWLHGGFIANPAMGWTSSWLQIDGDFIVGTLAAGVFPQLGNALFGSIYIETGQNLTTLSASNLAPILNGDGQNVIWGPGIYSQVAGNLLYKIIDGGAQAVFHVGTLELGSSTTVCSRCGNNLNCTIPLTAANLDAPCDAGLAGNAINPTGFRSGIANLQ